MYAGAVHLQMKRKKSVKKKCTLKLSSLKNKAWKLFSEWTRRKWADAQGFVACITCQKMFHWKALQAGHFIAGRGNSILFDERGTNPQCYGCNCHKHGDWPNYMAFMEKKYGQVVIEELKKLSLAPRKFTPDELQEKIAKYKTLLGGLDA